MRLLFLKEIKFLVIFNEERSYLNNIRNLCIECRLTALGRVIEFGSGTRLESWRFVSTRFESLGDSISRVGIDDSSRFLELKSKPDSKNRPESPRLLIK